MRDAHSSFCSKVNFVKYPAALYCAYYQDGLIHGLERITNMRSSGQSSDVHRNRTKILGYLHRRKERLRQKRYSDVAYIDGYIEALFLVSEDNQLSEHDDPSPFYAIGYTKQIPTWTQYKNLLGKLPRYHKAAAAMALKDVKRIGLPSDGSIVVHHRVAV